MEGGRIVDRGTHEELLAALAAVRARSRSSAARTCVFLQRDSRSARRWPSYEPRARRNDETSNRSGHRGRSRDAALGGRAETEDQANQPGRLAGTLLMLRDIWRLLRGEDQRARKVRWMLGLLRPYRRQVVLMMIALVIATAAALAPPALAGAAIDNGIKAFDEQRADRDRARLHRLGGASLWVATYAQTYLVGWVGQRALQDLRSRIYTHLQTMSIGFFTRRRPGRADLAADQRRAGARQPGHRRRRDPVLEHADAGRRRRDPAPLRRPVGAGHLRHLPAARDRLGDLPDRLRGRLPADAGEDREHHRLPAGDALGRAGGAHLRPRGAPRLADDGAQRGEPRGQHADRLPQRGLLPRRSSCSRRSGRR